MKSLEGARVLVTGASSGIGLAAARRFADAGAEVAVLARSEAVERAAQDIGTVAERADITDRSSLAPAVERLVERLGGLDVAVVNAGGASYGRFDETPPDDFDRAVGLTLLGAVNTVRCVLPHLEHSDGRLVVVS
jgi:NAD(P)-dependent dehydrogenase (short-subunit alcohol dehydrogenase family)